jgi:hypothetical protein
MDEVLRQVKLAKLIEIEGPVTMTARIAVHVICRRTEAKNCVRFLSVARSNMDSAVALSLE